MKKHFTLLFIFGFLFSTILSAQTEVSGGIFENTSWTAEQSPYYVTDDVVIFPDYTLTIEPGVEIQFYPDTKLENRDGNLIAIGTSEEPIVFTAFNTAQKWKGIINNNIEQDSLQFLFENVEISYAETGIDYGAEYAYQTLTNATFSNNDRGVYDGGQGYHWIQLYNCTFIDNGIGMEGRMSVWNSSFQGNTTGFANPLSFYTNEEGGRIINCSFIDNETAVGSIYQYMTFAYIKNSTFRANGDGVYLYWAEIDSSSIESCSGTAIWLQKGSVTNSLIVNNEIGIEVSIYAYEFEIVDNEISLNNYGLKLSGPGALIENNNICNNVAYNAFLNTPESVDIKNNCWCTDEEEDVTDGIYDAYDDVSLGIATYNPIDLSCLGGVFPGDADKNGLVDASDVLFVGLKMGQTGPSRPNASMYWIGQIAEDWDDNLPHGINTKHVDTNGDGVIDAADMDAILMNYSHNHTDETETEIPLAEQAPSNLYLSLIEFDGINLKLNLENSGIVENIKGLSFSMLFNAPLAATEEAVWSSENSWWINPTEEFMDMTHINEESDRIDFAFVSTAEENLSGEGNLITLHFIFPEFTESVAIEFDQVMAMNNEGHQIEMIYSSYTEVISAVSTDLEAAKIQIAPNPVGSTMRILNAQIVDKQQIDIQSISGQTVKSVEYSNEVYVGDLEPGIYFVRFRGESGLQTAKFVKL